MKKLLFIICLFAVVSCSKSADWQTPEQHDNAPVLVGSIYTVALSRTISVDQIASGYKFISETKAVKITSDQLGNYTTGAEVNYSGVYPNLAIDGEPAVFSNATTFSIGSVVMLRWSR